MPTLMPTTTALHTAGACPLIDLVNLQTLYVILPPNTVHPRPPPYRSATGCSCAPLPTS